MKLLKTTLILSLGCLLASCAITPEQKAEREAKRVRAEQALQVQLAKQCDAETAELMHEQFNPPLHRTAKAQADFEKRYSEKVNNPVFQACYKLALENRKAQEEIEYLRMHYDDMRFGFGRFCNMCW